MQAEEYIRFLAKELVIDEGLIMGEYRKKTANRFFGGNPVPRAPVPSAQPVPSALEQAERKLLLLFFRYSGLIDSYKDTLQQTGFA